MKTKLGLKCDNWDAFNILESEGNHLKYYQYNNTIFYRSLRLLRGSENE